MEYKRIDSFDKTENTFCYIETLQEYSDIFKLGEKAIITRGAGLSYCNASFAKDSTSINMPGFNRILNFDNISGRITLECGVTAGEVNNFLHFKEWMLPVLPGYPSITIGGCIAFNVHGKGQYKTGNFIDWVEEFVLYHPAHKQIICSRTLNEEIFNLTVGGMGFTGIILNVTLRLMKAEGNMLEIRKVKASNLFDAVSLMKEHSETWDYVYSWNDFNLKNNSFGRGIVYAGKYLSGNSRAEMENYENKLSKPRKFPNLYNRVTTRLMCHVFYLSETFKPASALISSYNAVFPIYGKEIYYYLFGKRGFREYQVLFSWHTWQLAADEIQKSISETNMPVTLGSLKLFSGKPHYLSLSGEGVCITINVANNLMSKDFFSQLDKITIKYNGRINLSKDSRAGFELVKQLFPEYELFKQRINTFDTKRIFVSDLRNRIQI